MTFSCSQLMSSVINHNWTDIARYGSLDNWKEVLAALVTYAGPEDFAQLCGELIVNVTLLSCTCIHTKCSYAHTRTLDCLFAHCVSNRVCL